MVMTTSSCNHVYYTLLTDMRIPKEYDYSLRISINKKIRYTVYQKLNMRGLELCYFTIHLRLYYVFINRHISKDDSSKSREVLVSWY